MLAKDVKWQESADIVIVGYGGAGAVAAVTAHDLGADVLILEKQPEGNHYTNTQMSGGTLIGCSETKKIVDHMEALYRVNDDLAWTDRDTLEAWAKYVNQNKAWIENFGGSVKLLQTGGEHKDIPGWESIEQYLFAGSGLGLHRFLTNLVSQRGIRVMWESPAHKLLTSQEGEILGVRVLKGKGKEAVDIKAKKAVIMTLGGFEYNEEMKLNYLKLYPAYFYGQTANTGDGHKMVAEVGADFWHMNCCSARFVAKFPDFPISFTLNFGGLAGRRTAGKKPPAGYVVVDRSGKRFTSENFKLHTLYYELTLYDSQRSYYPRVPSYWIFDRKRMECGPLPVRGGGPAGPVQLYKWEADNQNELKKGWIIEAPTLEELADKLGLPKDNLVNTVRTYNGYCEKGEGPEFNRRSTDLVPIDSPPYYSVPLYPGGPNTQGGPRRDSRARVLNVDRKPIPRLYAAGEFGSVYGMLYPSTGSNIAECIAFGRIAAENAVKEKPQAGS